MGKDLNRYFSKKDIQMASKHIKRLNIGLEERLRWWSACLASSVIKEMQIFEKKVCVDRQKSWNPCTLLEEIKMAQSPWITA
jgi:hypothetical protein